MPGCNGRLALSLLALIVVIGQFMVSAQQCSDVNGCQQKVMDLVALINKDVTDTSAAAATAPAQTPGAGGSPAPTSGFGPNGSEPSVAKLKEDITLNKRKIGQRVDFYEQQLATKFEDAKRLGNANVITAMEGELVYMRPKLAELKQLATGQASTGMASPGSGLLTPSDGMAGPSGGDGTSDVHSGKHGKKTYKVTKKGVHKGHGAHKGHNKGGHGRGHGHGKPSGHLNARKAKKIKDQCRSKYGAKRGANVQKRARAEKNVQSCIKKGTNHELSKARKQKRH